jgi:hypothetical protein
VAITIAYAALGGVVAVILPCVSRWAAFYTGLTWPMLISTAIRHKGEKAIYLANSRDADSRMHALMRRPSLNETIIANLKAGVEFVRDHADGLYD